MSKLGWQAEIERYPFCDGVHDVLHLTDEAQLEGWIELAHLDEPEVDEYLRTLAPPDMVYIPAGTFLMGSPNDDLDAEDNEKPQHEVWLRGYYMSRYPVTNEQYRAFMEADGYWKAEYWRKAEALGWWSNGLYRRDDEPWLWDYSSLNGPRRPVVGVSWHEALAYCRWVGMDLPTEAQWEKAAGWDATKKRMRPFPWGDQYDKSKDHPYKLPDVGHILPGEFNYYGISDMAVLPQWCRSKFQPYPYQKDDGREDLGGTDPRALRGDDFFSRCQSRSDDYPLYKEEYGFRTAFTI